jgi:putative intracellular protease/amidase
VDPERAAGNSRVVSACLRYGAAMDIAMLLFADVNALDAVGPYEVLRHLPDAHVHFVAPHPGPQHTEDGALALVAESSFDDVTTADVLVVPGGRGEVAIRDSERACEWVRAIDATSTWTTSVCTGSLILARAGLLTGKRATSHWTALETLRALGAEPTEERVVVQGKVVTAAGVSSGIDMALWLAGQLVSEEQAKAIQLAIEYDPQPPYDSGSTNKAHPELVDRMFRASRFYAA